jgi:hypothetical protein
MVSFDSDSQVSIFRLQLICFGEQYSCIFSKIYHSNFHPFSILQYRLLAILFLLTRFLWISFAEKRSFFFQTTTKLSSTFFLVFHIIHQIYLYFFSLYEVSLVWNNLYIVVLFLHRAIAAFGILYHSLNSISNASSSHSLICFISR